MRNLKKVLSLALAMVMLLGMMVVGAGATSFTDDADITHQEAVTVVSGMEILTGVGDNTFNPKGTLSRAEAAVVIAKLDLGAAFGNLATTNASTFKDVGAGYGWAKPYIDYCAARGLIAGDGNGYFMPADKVTGVQFALMVARVLGYEDANENIGGADWEVNAAALARKAGLTVDVELGSDAIPRDDMAQVAFNALTADMVEYKQSAITIGDITIPAGKASPVENNDGAADHYNGVNDSKLQLCEEKFPKLKLKTDDEDGFKRPASTWTYGADTITTVTNDATYTLNDGFKGGKMYSTIGKVAAGYTMTVYVDGVEDTTLAGITKSGNDTDFTGAGNGSVTEVYVDTDSKTVTVCTINTYLVRATANYNSTKEELSVAPCSPVQLASGKISNDDVVVSEFAKDDLILVTGTFSSGKLTVKTAEPAEVVENVKVSAYNGSKTVTAGGTKYNYSFKVANTWSEDFAAYALQSTNYNMILDKAGNVIAVVRYSTEATLDNILFVKDAGNSAFTIQAKALFMDGSEETITVTGTAMATDTDYTDVTGSSTVEQDSNGLGTAGNVEILRFYEFNKKSDGTYQLKDLAQATVSSHAVTAGRQGKIAALSASGKNVDGSKVTPVASDASNDLKVSANNDTVFIAKDKVYTGLKDAPTVEASDTYYLLDKTGTYLMAVYTKEAGTAISSTWEYAYVLEDTGAGKDDNGNSINYYTVAKDGEKVENFEAAGTASPKGVGLYAIKSTNNGYPVLGTKESATESGIDKTAITFKSGVVTVDGTGYKTNDDSAVYFVSQPAKSVGVLDVSAVETIDNGTYDVYVIPVSNTDATIKTLWLVKTSSSGVYGGTSSTDLQKKLDAENSVVVSGNVAGKVTVGSNQTLTLTGSGTVGSLALNGGTVVVDQDGALPAIDANGTGTISVSDGKTAGVWPGIVSQNYAVQTTATAAAESANGQDVAKSGIVFSGEGNIAGFSGESVANGGALYHFTLPAVAQSKAFTFKAYVGDTEVATKTGSGSFDGSGDILLLLGTDRNKVVFEVVTTPAAGSTPAVITTYTFNIK